MLHAQIVLLCGTEVSRMFLPELYPWRLSFGLAIWKWKGRGRRPHSFPVWVVSIERTLVNQLYRRWLRLRRGLASRWCLRVLLHRRGWMGSEYGCKSRRWFGFALDSKLGLGDWLWVRTRRPRWECVSCYVCVLFLSVLCRLYELVKWTVWRGVFPLPSISRNVGL